MPSVVLSKLAGSDHLSTAATHFVKPLSKALRTMISTDPWHHVRGLEPLSLCDWPGKPCCVVFLGGCNLRCPTCHNAELAWNMEKQPLLPQARLRTFLTNRKRWLSGVTITGGEPTAVPGLGEILH